MSTLITSGCSYTKYKWDTWADYLANKFLHSQNLGEPGAGNKYIYHSILNYIFTYNQSLEDHTFVIEWSSIKRHDFMNDEGKWQLGGQVDNNDYYTLNWVRKYFDLEERIRDLYFYVNHLSFLQKEKKFNLKMFYMFEPWIKDFAGEPASWNPIYNSGMERYKQSTYLKELKLNYKDRLWIKPSLEKFAMTYDSWGKNEDTHPPTEVHKDYSELVYDLL